MVVESTSGGKCCINSATECFRQKSMDSPPSTFIGLNCPLTTLIPALVPTKPYISF